MSIAAEDDIITLLLQDHQLVAGALEEISHAGAERAELFWHLTDQLLRHEVAEEIVLFPEVRRVPSGAAVADARIAEQAAAEDQLKEMEELDPTGREFTARLAVLRRDVLQHAHLEETMAFPLLATSSDVDRRVAMGARYERAKRAAPNHPHPGVPDTPPGNIVVGPVVALLDRVRDAAARS